MPSEHEGPTMALLVRKDLRLSSGKVAVQCAHGAVNAALFAKKTETRIFQRWQETGTRKICLKVEDLIELNDYLKQAKMSGILTYVVSDAGMTEIPKGTVTVLAIGPAPRKSMDMLLNNLKPY